MSALLDPVDTILGVIIKKVVDSCWELGKAFLHRTSPTERELAKLKAALLRTMVTNHLDAPLADLDSFFERHPNLVMKHTANGVFVRRWLMDPYLQAFGSVPGSWTREKFERLRLDVAALQC